MSTSGGSKKGLYWVVGIIIVVFLIKLGDRSLKSEMRTSLTEADKLWNEDKMAEAWEKYVEAWKRHGAYGFKLGDKEKQELGPLLPNFYARTISYYVGEYGLDPEKNVGDLDQARDLIQSAKDNAVIVSAEVSEQYKIARIEASTREAMKAKGGVVSTGPQDPDRASAVSGRDPRNPENDPIIQAFISSGTYTESKAMGWRRMREELRRAHQSR